MDERQQEIFTILQGNSAMQGLNADQIWEIMPLVREIYVAQEDLFIHEGDLADEFFIIEQGMVAVLKDLGDGQVQTLAVLKAGDCIGELAIIENSPHASRSASVKALSAAKMLAISIDALSSPWVHSATHRQVILNLAQIVTQRLRASNEQPRKME